MNTQQTIDTVPHEAIERFVLSDVETRNWLAWYMRVIRGSGINAFIRCYRSELTALIQSRAQQADTSQGVS